MADIDEDEQLPAPSWRTCARQDPESGGRCVGRRVDGFDHCLAHLEPGQLNQALQRLGPGADLEAPGTDISAELFERLLDAVSGENGPPRFGSVSFAQARFLGNVSFADVRVSGIASFAGARFGGDAVFDRARFGGDALFIDTRFSRNMKARFAGARFVHGAWFDGARFSRDAAFNDAQFGGNASFIAAQFSGSARFDGTRFVRDAVFDGAQFGGNARLDSAQFSPYAPVGGDASFGGTRFGGDARFDGTWFGGDARFSKARFEKAASLGPLAAGNVVFQDAVFLQPTVIEAAAVRVTCKNTRWRAGVTMHLRYAQVELRSVTFTAPSFIVGIEQPFGLTPGFVRLDESRIEKRAKQKRLASNKSWMPVVLSLRGADASKLSFIDVDLSQHRQGIRLVLYLCLLGLKAIGRGLLQILRLIGEVLWDMLKGALEKLAEGGALTGAKFIITFLKSSPFVVAFLTWLLAGHRWVYVPPVTVLAVVAVVVVFLTRRRIADKWSLPMRLRYREDRGEREPGTAQTRATHEEGRVSRTGWYASYAHTEVGPYRTRRTAARELVTLRRHLRKADVPFKDRPFSGPSPTPGFQWAPVQQPVQQRLQRCSGSGPPHPADLIAGYGLAKGKCWQHGRWYACSYHAGSPPRCPMCRSVEAAAAEADVEKERQAKEDRERQEIERDKRLFMAEFQERGENREVAEALAARRQRDKPRLELMRREADERTRQDKEFADGTGGTCPVCKEYVPAADGIVLYHENLDDVGTACTRGLRWEPCPGTGERAWPPGVRSARQLGDRGGWGAGKNHAMNTVSVSTLLNTARRTG